MYHKADVNLFQEKLWPTQLKLSEMNDVSQMWQLLTNELRAAVDVSVPVKHVQAKAADQPYWFNKITRKLVTKHRRTYNTFKASQDPFYLRKYKAERRSHKAELRIIERDYISNHICKPLESGNSKPFYRHLKWSQSSAKPPMKLITMYSNYTEDPRQCADILNNFFCAQFCKDQLLDDANSYASRSPICINVSVDGIIKLLNGLKNGKSPGPDGIRKEDLVINPIMTAKCLSSIFKASLHTSKLPPEWEMAHVTPLHKRGAVDQPNNY